jgi:hypothetical protein
MQGFRVLIAMMSLAAPQMAIARPDLASAKRYVDGIYRALPQDGFDDRKVRRYASTLGRLIAEDVSFGAKGGGVGLIDYDPFCLCQDTAEDYHFQTRAVSTRSGATVYVRLNNGNAQNFAIDVVPLAGQWAVSDIHSSYFHSLVAYLRKNLPRTR